jgi:DNA-binding NtrC family response regulator
VAASVLMGSDGRGPTVEPATPARGMPSALSLDDRLREVEASLISWALRVSTGNKSKAAELLRIKRSTLGDRINRCGLDKLDDAVDEGVTTRGAA